MEVIILAGGKGSRLGVDAPPKALVKVHDRTILDYRIQYFKKQGVKKFILAVGYKKEEIKHHVESFYKDIDIHFSEEDTALGTAGAIKNAMKYVTDEGAFVTNVDDITDIKLENVNTHFNTICLARFKSPFGIVITEGKKVVEFKEKPLLRELWASCGFYYLKKNLVLPDIGSIECDVFPFMDLRAYKHKGKWITINTQKDIKNAEEEMLSK